MPDGTPFLIHALGRSRTAWLAKFLTYGPWKCTHEQAITLRKVSDIGPFFARPFTGTAETAANFGWRLIRHYCPDVRFVVIRRGTDDAIASMEAAYDAAEIPFFRRKLRKTFERSARILDEISALPGTLTVDHADLATEAGCCRIFEFCLEMPFDLPWWEWVRGQHVEIDLRAHVAYYLENLAGIDNFKRDCKRDLIRLAREGVIHAEH